MMQNQNSKFKIQKFGFLFPHFQIFKFSNFQILLLIFNFQFSIFNCAQAQIKPRVSTDTLRANVMTFTPGIKITGATVPSSSVLKVAADGTVSWGQIVYSEIGNPPAIPAQLNLIPNTGITITGTYPNLTISCD